MIKSFANYSIKKKVMIIVSATAGIVVFISFLISTFVDARSSREFATAHLTTLADVVAKNTASAITFDDIGAANETLLALETDLSVMEAYILNMQGEVFASYRRDEAQNSTWLHHVKGFNPEVIERPILENRQRIGKIRMVADFSHVLGQLVSRITRNSIGMAIAFFLGYLFLRYEMKNVLAPIGWLTNAIGQIIDDQQYALRVKKVSSDELGNLTDAFNLMLTQIEMRDAKLRQSDEALSQTQEAIALLDVDLNYQYVNPAFVKLFGYQLKDFDKKEISLFPDDHQSTREALFSKARDTGSYRGELEMQTKSGLVLPVLMHVSPIKDSVSDEITGYVSFASDISEKKEAEAWILHQANYDSVTGLPNRHMMHQRLENEIKHSQKTGDAFAVMFLDLDDFKEVNDSLGHDMGDLLLKYVGERLQGCLRTSDVVGSEGAIARLGGDEFTIVLCDAQSSYAVESIAQRILTILADPFRLAHNVVNISASIGITLYPKDAADAEALMRNADQAMYDAKNNGRNTYSFFTPAIQEAGAKRRQMTHDLRVAIEQEQFQVLYQPIVELATQRIHKAEALLRWHHPENGVVNPTDFIPVAEDTGLIVDIGDWVFFHVTKQLKTWRESLHQDFQISINKSPVQFHDKASSLRQKRWFDYLSQLGIPGSGLVVEITEGLMLDKKADVSERLLAYRDQGVQVAVDDFGTGYSSLSYLKKFDVDYIKIDQSFVKNLSEGSEDMVLCEAIIVMAHKLGLKVVAEGVETVEQRDLLLAVGCDYGQGYLFSKPTTPNVIEQLCLPQKTSNVRPIRAIGTNAY